MSQPSPGAQPAPSLGQSEERFRLLVEGVKDYAIFMLDPQGRVTTWNAGAESIKGYTAQEIIGQHFSRFYPPEQVERGWPDEELRRATAEGRFEDEGWRVRKDGTTFWANVVITALRDDSGSLRGFVKVTRDLTERRQAEEQARLLIHEETRQPFENPVRKVFRERRVVELANHTALVTRDGREVPVEDTAAPIRGKGGEVGGAVLVFRDVTQARRAAEARLHLASIVE